MASTAVRLAQESFARLDESTVLLIGAGETIELAARHLAEAKVQRLLVANRTLAHAQELASRHGGIALPLAELDRHLAEADIVISATASRTPILHRAQVEHALRLRRHRPMLLLDLAVPRDIDNAFRPSRRVLYTVDDLERRSRTRRGRCDREQDEALIDLQTARFVAHGRQRPQQPLLRLRAHARRRARMRWRGSGRNRRGMPRTGAVAAAHTLTNAVARPRSPARAALSGDSDLARASGKCSPAARTSTGHDPRSAESSTRWWRGAEVERCWPIRRSRRPETLPHAFA